jgi:RNA polymerase sigma factor (sigma-70 family)
MAHEPLAAVLRHLRRWVGGTTGEDESDGQLLERFAMRHDEAAFATLMQRHGPLVLSVCRRLLPTPHDVDDAFQATFVVLVRRAAALKKEGSLGSWLYTVAYRIALKARAQSARRRAREQQVETMDQQALAPLGGSDPSSPALHGELRAVLDDEVNRLPEKYRAAMVLCYLEGKTNEQAARELGCPVGSMSWRLDKGRALLRNRLAGRGIALSAAGLATALSENAASAAVPATLGDSVLRTAMLLISGKAAAGVLSAPVASLADGFLHTLWLAKVRFMAVLFLALGLAGSGAAVFAYHTFTARKSVPVPGAELAAGVDQRVADWQPTPAERRIDEIGWAPSVAAALRLAKEHNRPVFLFVHEGFIATGRCGGSAFNLRAFGLADDRVIGLLNRYFVPVYHSRAEYPGGVSAPADEKALVRRIYGETLEAKMHAGDDCIYILSPDGEPIDSFGIRPTRQPEQFAERLQESVRKLGTQAGQPLVKPGPQSVPPPPGPDDLVLHLTARILAGKAWCEFPAENWLVLPPADWKKLVPPDMAVGSSWEIDPELAGRLLVHFYPQSENNDLGTNRIDRQSLRGQVVVSGDSMVRVRLDGHLRMKHRFYNKPDDNFVEAPLTGYLDYDPNARRIRALRLVTENATYGDKPFGVALRSLP